MNNTTKTAEVNNFPYVYLPGQREGLISNMMESVPFLRYDQAARWLEREPGILNDLDRLRRRPDLYDPPTWLRASDPFADVDAPSVYDGVSKHTASVASGFVAPLPAVASVPRVALPVSLPDAPTASGLVVDYLNFTYPIEAETLLDALKTALGEDWQDMERGFYGYRQGVRSGNIVILWSGGVEGMGIHVQLSGQGCRELEAIHREKTGGELDWRVFLADRVKEGARFSQTHFAFDDLAGNITVKRITDAYKKGQCVTRFGTFQPIETYGKSGELTSYGFYFGKRSADTSICVYDKKLEQESKLRGGELSLDKQKELEKGWTRLELRNRNKRSQALVEKIIAEGWSVVASVLRGYLDIRNVTKTQDNKMRVSVVKWWGAFTSWADSARLKVDGVAKTMQAAMNWLDRQVGTVLAMVKTVMPENYSGLVEGIMDRGADRFKRKHLGMMSNYLLGLRSAVASSDLAPVGPGAGNAAFSQSMRSFAR